MAPDTSKSSVSKVCVKGDGGGVGRPFDESSGLG